MQVTINAVLPETDEMLDLLQYAWTILANVSEGDWSQQSPDWRVAVATWRDCYHGMLREYAVQGIDATRAPERP